MRLGDESFRRWLRLNARNSFRTGLRQKAWKKQRRREGRRIRAEIYLGEEKTRAVWVSKKGQPMPANFCLTDNYDEVSKFLAKVRVKIHEGAMASKRLGKPRPRRLNDWFDMAHIDRITPGAALVLAAEFDRGRRLTGKKLFAINVKNWKPAVGALLKQIGLFSILEIDGIAPVSIGEGGILTALPVRSGDVVLGEEADGLTQEVATLAIDAATVGREDLSTAKEEWQEKALSIYQILMEAMNNVIEHAYPDDGIFSFGVVRRWWMTAALDRSSRRLTVAIFDQGVSIPMTLHNWKRYDVVRRWFDRVTRTAHDRNDTARDHYAIAAAMKVAVSSTGKGYRGQGLGLMAAFLETCRDGKLRIVSRCGEVVYAKGRKRQLRAHEAEIGGTLVEWEVLL